MSIARTPSNIVAVERRRGRRASVFVNAHGYRVEALDQRQVAAHRGEWLALSSRSIEPNVFFGPDFALAAANCGIGEAPVFVVIRRMVEGRMQLVGVLPLVARDLRSGRRTVRIWSHKYLAAGTPLLDRRYFKGAFDAALDWLASLRPSRCAILIPAIRVDGEFARMTVARARRLCGAARPMGGHERSQFLPTDASGVGFSRKTLKSFARHETQLSNQGDLSFHIHRDPKRLTAALEQFLELEAMGWKGERGTALAKDESVERFARAIVNGLAERGCCLIASLELAGRPIAMSVLPVESRVAAFWKTAYDERFAKYSPGLMMLVKLSEALRDSGEIDSIDSCAAADDLTMLRVWRGRIRIADLLISTMTRPSVLFGVIDARERAKRSMRGAAKSIFSTIRKRLA